MHHVDGYGQLGTYTIRVNDTNPIWLYCSQGKHCQNGMVAAINAPAGKTLAQYAAAAKNVASNVSPASGPFGGIVGSTSAAAAATTTTGGVKGTTTGSASQTSSTGGAGAVQALGRVALGAAVVAGVFLA